MKQIVRAFALGLFTSSLIIGAVYFFTGNNGNQNNNAAQPSDTEIDVVAEARKQGYFVYNEDMDAKITELENEVARITSEAENETSESTNDETGNITQWIFTIDQGTQLSEIAERLEQYGFISNQTKLIQYLEENQLTRQVQPGEYLLNDQMTIGEIASIITKSPNEE
ncbi:YceG-like family protein [Gracilibacillus ureilyticus]|uniref:YceG-like family protein n=1 Tax=Gracilibacillus ureilyticus TaxID=531814 RepID=A0A1H9M095_9BACI|nr:endolytic transglycosylase MltG [Gracilibacillus ureilyticus]SER17088.1 YceG-like family protein [Gracilibacillus ureilyticus]